MRIVMLRIPNLIASDNDQINVKGTWKVIPTNELIFGKIEVTLDKSSRPNASQEIGEVSKEEHSPCDCFHRADE